ncbi:MAG: NADH-quinone oxidoreductase subunit C, partial [Acidimicrobiia bacterium]|nr:NADH-quinone oxidoreductase subunit C [Acidimicrobiia bacterium]
MGDDAPVEDEPVDDEVTDGADEPTGPEVETAYGAPVTRTGGHTVLHTTPDTLLDVAQAVRDDGFAQLIDLCGVDYLTHPGRTDLPETVVGERFEVVVSLINHQRGERVRLRVQVPEAEPVLPTLFDIWPGAEALERETYDMFGVTFADHPDMTRILMPEDWVGHPLRKDYAVGRIPVQFK